MRGVCVCLLLAACGSSSIDSSHADSGVADGPVMIADGPIVTADGRLVDAPIVVADASPGGCLSGLQTLTLMPGGTTVTLDGATAAPVTFTASGHFADNHDAAVAAGGLTWSVKRDDDTPPGTIVAGVLMPFPSAGGVVTVSATDGCITGTTTITFVIASTVGTPPAGWDDATVMTGGTAPTIVYPSDQTRFPRNVYRILFQWTANGFTTFRVIFTGPRGTVTVYTDGVHADCAGKSAGCWEADEHAWSLIAGSNAGATATVTVDALDGAIARRSGAITIGFSKRDVKGAIFYWSTTAKGIRRGSLASGVPENYLAGIPPTTYPDGDTVQCAACHVVSRDGKYMAAPAQSKKHKNLWILEVTPLPPPTPRVQDIASTDGHGFATFSPDDKYLVAAWKGKMWQLDRTSGVKMADLMFGTVKATHPDWSPDNTQLVFATADGDAPAKAGLALTAYTAPTTWGAPQVLVPADGKTNLFPQFSPDGKWIAYSRGDKGSHDDPSMQLYLVRAQLGATPVLLERASCVVSTSTSTCKTENYEPTWAPSGDLDWVAFNSERAYGVVLAPGRSQLWVSAVDTTAAGDPSYPAFRVPFQGLAEDNHRAFWTQDIRETIPQPDAGPPPDAGPEDARVCIPDLGACDPVFDKCCGENYVCDTNDDGMTYTCLHKLIE